MSGRNEKGWSRLPDWPRGMNMELAAAYLSLSPSLLRSEVEAGEAPQPVWLTAGRKIWLREDLDAYLDRKAGKPAVSPNGNGSVEAPEADWEKAFTQHG